MPGTVPLDLATLRAIFATVERRLYELGRRSGACATCRSADLRLHLDELRGLLDTATRRAAGMQGS
jgi:hypothetical protein